MPISKIWTAIDLGYRTYGDGSPYYMDLEEGNGDSEAAYDLVGAVFGSSSAPLYDHLVTIDASNPGGINSSELLQDNRQNGTFYADTFKADFNDGNGQKTYEFDALTVYNATVTFRNGQTANVTAVVFQAYDGRLFLAPEYSDNSDSVIYRFDGIRSLRLNSIAKSTGILGLNTSRVGGSDGFVCFASGTMIATPGGAVPVEDLKVGDLVQTLDHDAQPLVWVGRHTLSQDHLHQNENHRPIRIPQGALGHDLPERDLVVSPQHRVLIASRAAERLFGHSQALVAATHLVGVNGIAREGCDQVTYHHIMCADHQIVFSDGAPTETMYAGKMALKSLPADSRAELLTLFPELESFGADAVFNRARPFLNGRQGRKTATIHATKSRPLLEKMSCLAQ